ncbi:MAG: anti-sigma regulatory factor [Microcoleaceae cyanobacterium MO_207.B10]|nr:anti-sigma regulatory factor [Microcoleaceae cyanobacterium MO_207.B10]
MIAISSRPRLIGQNWVTISFASTLYLCPILDLLLADVPLHWHAELRLGLQEALVNAAKHGNDLDPSKTVLVRFSIVQDHYWWVISDQGPGFQPPCSPRQGYTHHSDCYPENYADVDTEKGSGRGIYIIYQLFDYVEWNSKGTELMLCKKVRNNSRLPLVG